MRQQKQEQEQQAPQQTADKESPKRPQPDAKPAGAGKKKTKLGQVTDDKGRVTEVDGVKLHLTNSVSGYKGVVPNGAKWSASAR